MITRMDRTSFESGNNYKCWRRSIIVKKELFREKSMEQLSAPDQIKDYIQVSTPGVWMFMTAVILLLVGVCVWGIFGKMDTIVSVCAVSENGSVTCYVKEADISSVKEDMPVRIGNDSYRITEIANRPISVDDDFDGYALHVGGIRTGEWVYAVSTDAQLEDGVYQAEIVVESIQPITFVVD